MVSEYRWALLGKLVIRVKHRILSLPVSFNAAWMELNEAGDGRIRNMPMTDDV